MYYIPSIDCTRDFFPNKYMVIRFFIGQYDLKASVVSGRGKSDL